MLVATWNGTVPFAGSGSVVSNIKFSTLPSNIVCLVSRNFSFVHAL